MKEKPGGIFMSKIYTSMEQLIGHTPLIELTRIEKVFRLKARVLAKIEFMNPAGSIKDRVALQMITDAEQKGLLAPGGTIIEPTSGNTGIGLAAIAAVRGYSAIIVMPDSMSVERQRLIKAYGASVVLTPGVEGMRGAIAKAEELAAKTPGSFIPDQFNNSANAAAHEATTGPEIWEDTEGNVDIFVAGVGTGGTITGTGRYLKQRKPDLQVVAVEPADSPLLSRGVAGPHGLQGIGANFIPSVLDTAIYDKVVTVQEKRAFQAARLMAYTEGILVGISSGAALYVALEMASLEENAGKTIVVVLPDTGERYLSTTMFA
jgi:cysteine synthase A